jgi:hypothetical protein
MSSQFFRQGFGLSYVAVLGLLVTTAEQDDHKFSCAHEVDAITGTLVDPHLAHPLAYGLYVTRVAE